MVDWSQPLRTKRSQRRVFLTGWDRFMRMVDGNQHGINSGFRFDENGTPVDEGCPWGEIENAPVEDAILSIEHVEKKDAVAHDLREQRQAAFAAKATDDNANNPIWGMF